MSQPPVNSVGDVYFAQVGCFIKIGFAQNVKARLNDLQVSCPLKITIRRTIWSVPRWHERWLHAYFSDRHVRGEWFRFCSEMDFVLVPEEAKYWGHALELRGRQRRAAAKMQLNL